LNYVSATILEREGVDDDDGRASGRVDGDTDDASEGEWGGRDVEEGEARGVGGEK
jgi:hypothetical protein